MIDKIQVTGWADYEAIKAERNELRAELQKRHDLLAKAFGQPRGEDGKCICAYCRRDFEAIAEHASLLEMETASLQDEITRLRAGGCARDQRTTQFCAEAVALVKERDQWRAVAEQLEKELRGALNHGSSFLVNGRATTFHWNPEEGENALAAYKKLIKTP